jgi:tetratricopeptide (TPR) repeat protein
MAKKMSDGVLGVIGAITAIVAFVVAWQDNLQTFTTTLAVLFLIVGLAFLFWVGFSYKTRTLDLFSVSGEKTTKKEPRYSQHWRRFARIALVIFGISAIVGGGWLYKQRAAQLREREAQIAELKNKLVVLVVNFDAEKDDYKLKKLIVENLNATFKNDERIKIVPIDAVVTENDGSDYARKLGEEYYADLVIWGWYGVLDSATVYIHIENLNPKQFTRLDNSETMDLAPALADMRTFTFQLQAGQELSALISFSAGVIEYQAGNYKTAIAYFDSALKNAQGKTEIIKNQAEMYFMRGAAHYSLQEADLALADYSESIQLDPQDAKAYTNRGILYKNLGKSDQALADYAEAIRLDPQEARIYNNRGNLYKILGKSDLALADYNEAIRLDPQEARIYNNRGNLYADLDKSDPALADYNEAIRLAPQDAWTYTNRGNLYADLGKSDQALADYSEAIRLAPQDAWTYTSRGMLYAKLGSNDLALADYTEVIKINPQDAEAYFNRWNFYMQLGKPAEASADLAKWAELTVPSP